MKCTACGFSNIDEVKFCGKCGIRLAYASTSIIRAPYKTTRLQDQDESIDTTQPATREKVGIHGKTTSIKTINLSISASQYEIIEHIGSGGMGTVYLAKDLKLDRYVALKRLGSQFLNNPWMKARLFREAKSIAALNHSHIVQVYALGEDNKGPFIVMEYIAGPGKVGTRGLPNLPLNLSEKIQRAGVFSAHQTVVEMRKLCKAMAYAHAHGVVHRDLKPSNVLITESGEQKIVDFGLARHACAEDARLTDTGFRILSLGYGAPEQEADVSKADERADIYALGGMLYFCLTAENPRFFRENNVPEHLRSPLLRAMAKDPEERWQTVKEFDQSLAAVDPSASLSGTATTSTGMWRCKWCHTTNPSGNRYCAECGWDGLARCPECKGETRIGIRFCGACGSDIKTFEEAEQLLARLRQYMEERNFICVVDQADAIKVFHARQDPGTAILHEVADLKENAAKALRRKDFLMEAIPKAMENQNYVHVQELVLEYDALDDADIFSELKKELPAKVTEWRILDNMKRAREAVKQHDWQVAERCCQNIVEKFDSTHTEARSILVRIMHRKRAVRTAVVAAMIVGFLVVYVLSFCPLLAMSGNTGTPARVLRTIYAPARWVYKSTFFRVPLQKYAQVWGVNLDQ